jgi:hypothetical protein
MLSHSLCLKKKQTSQESRWKICARKYIKEEGSLTADEINEGIYLDELVLGGKYFIRRRIEQNDKFYDHRTQVSILEQKGKVFGVSVYTALHEYGDILYITGDDVK